VDVLLVTVTLASLLVAGAMSLVAWRMARDERARSAARVAALSNEIASDTSDAEVAAVAVPMAWADMSVTSGAPEPALAMSGASGLFATTSEPARPAWARVAPALLAGVVLVGGVAGTAVMLSGGGGTATAAAAHDPRPLELLSLRHAIADGNLSITGLVRNPAGNVAQERLTAVVFLFDDKGGFLASGRSLLDFTSLAPGEESPFQIALTAPPGVARYRVSFRRDEGGVLPHVDRREARMP
jgi:hypothetical protein